MTNPIINPQPNYSGVTIQIANPAVNVVPDRNFGGCSNPMYNNQPNSLPAFSYNGYQQYPNNPQQYGFASGNGYIPNYPNAPITQASGMGILPNEMSVQDVSYNQEKGVPLVNKDVSTQHADNSLYPQAYPAEYYLNKYGNGTAATAQNDITDKNDNINSKNQTKFNNLTDSDKDIMLDENVNNMNSYKMYADKNSPKDTDMTRSTNIIEDLDERVNEQEQEKKNTKETKIVALTDEYIKSLENYLNNPNDEIRLMASKEILTRLDEDKDRYNDAALNALLNKMIQDPSKLVRIAALSAFASQLASGNDYTVQLLQNIQSNPNADKEDVLQAADILLKMSAGVEVKNIPNPSTKNNEQEGKA